MNQLTHILLTFGLCNSFKIRSTGILDVSEEHRNKTVSQNYASYNFFYFFIFYIRTILSQISE